MIAAQPSRQEIKWKTASGGSYQKPLKSFGDLTFATQYCTGFAINLSANSPPVSCSTSEDPIGVEGGLNLFKFNGDNPVNNIDPFGEGYWALRPLKPFPWIPILSHNFLYDWFNREVAHEQYFFDDGSNVGFFDIEGGSLQDKENPKKYRCPSEQYNDCIIKKAIARVKLRRYNFAGFLETGIGQFNCQDWATAVRREYNRLIKDPLIKMECGAK